MCAIHKPAPWAHFEEEDFCRVCLKLTNQAYQFQSSQWDFLSETYDEGRLLWLCQDCIDSTEKI
jgi:hypothetical protein